jgi:hypothetical protein
MENFYEKYVKMNMKNAAMVHEILSHYLPQRNGSGQDS